MLFSRRYTRKPITDIFTSDTDIDRRQCTRVVPMKVLILGLGRTGTSSMREAMKQLGFIDTYHMMSVSIENPPDALLWLNAFAAKYENGPPFTRENWDQLLGHCQAVCDWPAIAFAKELVETYPEAKVILTNRDVDSWYASTLKTVYWRVTEPEIQWLQYVSWGAGYYYPMLKKFFDTFFEGDFEGKGKEIFLRHYEEVRQLVPKDRLLEFKVTEGWGPLCEFLEVPKPLGRSFPHVNDNTNFVARSKWRNKMQMANAALGKVVMGVIFAACWYFPMMVVYKVAGILEG
ncbi:P-loop containing nucleoside triphosphate hydrolase protein [Xylogone sp. PMI_703]|nr:P-loop containing nucleoside triphosphate hydrolase protein [Xylogone sp. PMI_703]